MDDDYPKSDALFLLQAEFGEGKLEGRLRHLYLDEFQAFTTIAELFYGLQNFMDVLNSPQETFLMRREWKPASYAPMTRRKRILRQEPVKTGRLEPPLRTSPSYAGMKWTGETFLLNIRFRQNVSWQGDIRWLNCNKKFVFRSALELLMLLEEMRRQG